MLRACLVLSLLAACGFSATAGGAPDAASPDGAIDTANVDDGLIAWYRMDVLTSAVEDDSGHGHIGTCTSCPTVVPGKRGAAYDFSIDRIDVADTAELRTTSAFTVAMWVRFDALPAASYACAIGKGQNNGIYNTWQLCYEASSQAWMFGSQGTSFDFLRSTPGPAVDTWHHAAISWNGSLKQLWIDGQLRVSRPQTGIRFDGAPITIGADVDNNANVHFLDGKLDEVRIYKRALAAAEIATLAN